jgi:secondary thiamine-phosphate synthase enzyme
MGTQKYSTHRSSLSANGGRDFPHVPRIHGIRHFSRFGRGDVKTHTSYLTFNTKKRQEIIDITDEVEACRAAAGISEGFVLVSAMHISASVFVNDHEPGLWKDILDWLEERIAPWSPDEYRHNTGTGEDNAAAHLRSLTIGHEVIVPVTRGRLDFGPWQRVFYGEWDGQRSKRVIIKAMGE